MTQEAQPLEPELVAAQPKADETLEPIDPVVLMKQVLRALAGVPWVALGAMGTGCGVALLVFYFRSIDFFPADIPAILSASILMAMLAVAFCVALAGSLLVPLWIYREAGLDDQTSTTRVSGFWSLQLLGVGSFILLIWYRFLLGCVPSTHYVFLFGAILASIGLVGWVVHEKKTSKPKHARWRRLLAAAGVCVLGVLPLLAVKSLLIPEQGVEGLHIGVAFAVWLLVIVGSSTWFSRIPLWGCALMLLFAAPLFLFSLPGLTGRPSALPTTVAELAGIRIKAPVELRVPSSTCKLIQSAVGSASTEKPLVCEEGDWGTVHAQVLSNLGDRWWIELKLAGTAPEVRGGAIRLTIPGEGVQTLHQIAAPASKAACST